MYKIDHLNPRQREAVFYNDGPLLILGGPGSGKTQVLLYRIAHLIREQKVNPANILVITFTAKAAIDMKAQLEYMLGVPIGRSDPHSRLYFGTFRSVCISILRQHIERLGYNISFSICDELTRLSRIKACLADLYIDPIRFQPRAVAAKISALKNNPARVMDLEYFGTDTAWDETVSRVYTQYEKMLYEAHELDNDDIFRLTFRLFQQNPVVLAHYQDLFRHILIDEYQETTPVQRHIVHLLSEYDGCLCLAGDDDQCIFETRGADMSNLMNFEKDYSCAKVITLEQNYRSSRNILDAASAVISRNRARIIKALRTQKSSGNNVLCFQANNEHDEASFICGTIVLEMKSDRNPWDIVILYRTNAQSSVLEDALMNHGIPYRVFDDSAFNEPQEIVDIPTGTPMVTLMTLHNAKGLEFPIVFIAGMEERLLPHSRAEESKESLEEERRLFYMGITRARERLIITHAKERNLYGYRQTRKASKFLGEIPSKLIDSASSPQFGGN